MGGSDLRRSQLVEAAAEMSAYDTDVAQAIRAELAPHHRLYCEKVLAGVRRGDRTAMNLYPRLVRAIGADSDLSAVLIAQLGVQSLDAARRIMDLAREADAEDSEALYERSMRFITDYRRRHGLPPLLEGQEVHADAAVSVEQAESHTNGHANGHANGLPKLLRNGGGPPRSGG